MRLSSAALFLAVIVAGCARNSPSLIPATASELTPPGTDRSAASHAAAILPPHASQVTVVVMENKDYDLIVGSANAPYINGTLIPSGALLTNSHAVGHPSEPNYLALFSGSTHGVNGDPCPISFSSANVGADLIAAGKTFVGYSESLPYDGYTGCDSGEYARKHSPWVDFTNVPSTDNLVYNGFPSSPPVLAWITPNLCNDMHDCSVGTGDTWLSKNLPPIVAWDAKHDGLLILTFDEADPDADGTNHIATVMVGPMIRAGRSDRRYLTHYSILHTIETIFGLSCIDQDCSAPLVTRIWRK